MSKFTDQMDAKAEKVADAMEAAYPTWKRAPGGRSNIKPWYSAKSVYKPGVECLVVGLDPGGDPSNPDDTTGPMYERNLQKSGFNAYLDEKWVDMRRGGRLPSAGSAELQTRIQRVFRSLWPEGDSDQLLRATACLNVCPVRTGKGSTMSDPVWWASRNWFVEAIDHIAPDTVICIGSGKSKSPWQSLCDTYLVIEENSIQVKGYGYLRWGSAQSGALKGSRVIGLPHLSRFWTNNLPNIIRDNRDSLLGPS